MNWKDLINPQSTGGLVRESREVQVIEQKKITVEDIHLEFMTASDKLIADVNDFLLSQKAGKAKRLERFGFSQSKDNVESIEFLKKKTIAGIVDKYRFTHPNNKVITHEKVHEICRKYNLVHCQVGRYTGFVPEKNLNEIESFKFPATENIMVFTNDYGGGGERFGPFETEEAAIAFATEKNLNFSWPRYTVDSPIKRLTICAPPDKIQLRYGERIEGNKIVYPDPIVLHQIENNSYLIVTAWGDEASDPEVVNEKMN